MPSASALAQAVAILTEHESEESAVSVDLCVSLRVCEVDASGTKPRFVPGTDEELIEVGGVWNRRSRRWEDGVSDSLMVIRIPRGSEQEIAARWLAEWLRRAAIGPRGPHWNTPATISAEKPREPGVRISVEFRRVWTLLLEGGRRGGKSYLAVVALVMFAVMVPNALVWAVSPTNEETDELEQAIRGLLPSAWYKFRGGGNNRASQFQLPNGARILLLSGHKPRTLKRGKVDLVLYNEGQNMSRAGWVQLRGAIGDTGGLVIVTANPPDAELGRWIEWLHGAARAGKIRAVQFRLTAATNPMVEVESLQDMADENDDLTYRREVLGEFVPIGEVAMHAWSDTDSVSDPPAHLVDVTAEETKRELGRAAGYVVGMDFQKTPHMVATVTKLFKDPTSDQPDELIAWTVDEVVVEDANEDDLIDALEAMPRYQHGRERDAEDCYHGKEREGADRGEPAHCAVVMDASAWWQDGEHQKGKDSDKRLRGRDWIYLYKPQRDSDRNPLVVERVKVANARLKSADKRDAAGEVIAPGRRRMFVAKHCEAVVRAMRSWEIRNGVPYKDSIYSHVCDAVTYVVYRFFARPKPKREGGGSRYKSVGPRFDRRSQLL